MPPQLGSDLGNLKRLVERSRQTRRWETAAFSTSGGGTLHVPRQKSRGVPTTGGGEGLSIGTPPIGEIIRVGIHSHLGNGNEPVLFNSIAYRNGFNKAVVPSSQVELPHGAIYGIEGELRWADGYTGGGIVTLLLDDEVYMTLPGFTGAWTRFSIATEFDAVQGQRLSIYVDHDDTDADHDLQGVLVIATKEPLKEVVTEPAEPFTFGCTAVASLGDSSPLTVSKPACTVEGDLLLFVATVNAAPSGEPSGGPWTEAFTVDGMHHSSPSSYMTVWYKTATASEPASYSLTIPSGETFRSSRGEIVAVHGGQHTLIDADGLSTGVGGGAVTTAPAVATVEDGLVVVCWGDPFTGGQYDDVELTTDFLETRNWPSNQNECRQVLGYILPDTAGGTAALDRTIGVISLGDGNGAISVSFQ